MNTTVVEGNFVTEINNTEIHYTEIHYCTIAKIITQEVLGS